MPARLLLNAKRTAETPRQEGKATKGRELRRTANLIHYVSSSVAERLRGPLKVAAPKHQQLQLYLGMAAKAFCLALGCLGTYPMAFGLAPELFDFPESISLFPMLREASPYYRLRIHFRRTSGSSRSFLRKYKVSSEEIKAFGLYFVKRVNREKRLVKPQTRARPAPGR